MANRSFYAHITTNKTQQEVNSVARQVFQLVGGKIVDASYGFDIKNGSNQVRFGFAATFDAAVKLKQINQEKYEVEAYVNWRPNMLFWICLVLGFFFLIPWIVNILYLFVDPSPYQKALDRMQGLV